MKKKILLFLIGVSCVAFSSVAQLTTGNTTANVVRTGNRAQAGDFGLYFGVTSDIFGKIVDSDIKVQAMPLVNLKYMQSDNLELRIGLELNKYSSVEKGSNEISNQVVDLKNKYVNVDNAIYPGVAYHFSKSNILDVYVGAELPIGYMREKTIREFDDDDYEHITSSAFNLGLGGFIGLQAYIGNLPLAVGLEYGISGRMNMNQKTKIETQTPGNDLITEYVSNISGAGYSDNLKTARESFLGNQLRFTITYFFK